MSDIRSAITYWSGIPIVFNDEKQVQKTIYAKDMHLTPTSLSTAQLPIRTIRTYAGDAGFSNFSYESAGDCLATTTWRIIDTLYYSSAVLSAGVHKVEPDLVRYSDAYLNIVRTHRTLTNNIEIESINSFIGFQEFPQGSNSWFEVVRVVLTLKELLQDD